MPRHPPIRFTISDLRLTIRRDLAKTPGQRPKSLYSIANRQPAIENCLARDRLLPAQATAQPSALHEALVVAQQEIRFDLAKRIERDTDDDQEACTPEEAGEVTAHPHILRKHRQNCDDRE